MKATTLEKTEIYILIAVLFTLIILCVIVAIAVQNAIYYVELGIEYYNQASDLYKNFEEKTNRMSELISNLEKK